MPRHLRRWVLASSRRVRIAAQPRPSMHVSHVSAGLLMHVLQGPLRSPSSSCKAERRRSSSRPTSATSSPSTPTSGACTFRPRSSKPCQPRVCLKTIQGADLQKKSNNSELSTFPERLNAVEALVGSERKRTPVGNERKRARVGRLDQKRFRAPRRNASVNGAPRRCRHPLTGGESTHHARQGCRRRHNDVNHRVRESTSPERSTHIYD